MRLSKSILLTFFVLSLFIGTGIGYSMVANSRVDSGLNNDSFENITDTQNIRDDVLYRTLNKILGEKFLLDILKESL